MAFVDYFTNGRKWSVKKKRENYKGEIFNTSVTPDEARVAVLAIFAQLGARVYDMEYDSQKDMFTAQIKEIGEEPREAQLRGEAVVETVRAMRTMSGFGADRMKRTSEIRAELNKERIDAQLQQGK